MIANADQRSSYRGVFGATSCRSHSTSLWGDRAKLIRGCSALIFIPPPSVYISTSHTHIPPSRLTGLATCAEKVSHLGTLVHDVERKCSAALSTVSTLL